MTPPPGKLEAQILEALRASRRGPLKPKEIARALHVETEDYKRFKRTLVELEAGGRSTG